MNPYNSISEEYRKYLIAFSYNDNTYYTVSGTDLEDETDKILVDAEGRFLLFRSISILREVLMSELRFFDPENLKKWVVASQGITVPYAQFNLDVLNTRMWDYKQLTTSKELFYTMGVVEDYAIQVGNTILHTLFEHELVREFKEISSDIHLWSINTVFDEMFDMTNFKRIINLIQIELEGRILIQ